MLRRSGGFDVPDFLAAGPRDIVVPQSGAQAAREALGTTVPAERGHAAGAGWHDPGCVRWPWRSPSSSSRCLAAGVIAAIGAVIWLRYGLPAALVIAGFVLLFVADGEYQMGRLRDCVGAGLAAAIS